MDTSNCFFDIVDDKSDMIDMDALRFERLCAMHFR